jgi:hypothetical protein
VTVFFPVNPAPVEATPRVIRAGGVLPGALGASDLLLNRLGDRMAIDVTLPPMPYDLGRVWISRLMQGLYDTVAMPFPQPDYVVGNPGVPVTDGSNHGVSTMALRGLTPGYALDEGQFLSVIIEGRRYLYQNAAPATAGGDGRVLTNFRPLLRKNPGDGAVIELASPVIEGLLQGREQSWTLDAARTVGLSFTIKEAK